MAPQAWITNTPAPTPDPAGYRADDLTIDLASRRVRRAGTVIPLKALSFDLLVTLARAAPNLLSFDELSERVWPGLVVTPETIVQRVKLLRDALGDDPQTPRYIEGVRGRGYRMAAEVRPLTLTESHGTFEFGAPLSLAAPRPAIWGPVSWIGGTLIAVAMLAVSGAIVFYRGATKPAALTSPVVSPAIHSLAVLPLENLSGDKEQEYFADGMTDALTTDLAQIGSLRVTSRTSAIQFKGSKKTLPQIGRDLKVDAIVEGAVTRGANRVRVTAQLVEASSDHHLWARTYERDLKDVLALQDEIAQDIAEQIRVTLTPKERTLLIQVHPVDPEAYDTYLRGSYWSKQASLEGWKKACDYFQKAVAKDPSYALAYIGVAHCQDTDDKAREIVLKALALDPSLAEAHTMLASYKFFIVWDWSGAEAEYKKAIAFNPNSAEAHHSYSRYLVAMDRLDEAMSEIERARDLDPYSAKITAWLGQVHYHARRYDDALRETRRGVEMYPNAPELRWDMADIYELKKMYPEAFAARQQALSLANDPRVTALDEAYKRSGYKGYLLKQAEFEQAHNPAYATRLYVLLNDEPRALAAMEAAYNQHNQFCMFLRTAPELDSIRSSPRFRDLVRRFDFPPPPSDTN